MWYPSNIHEVVGGNIHVIHFYSFLLLVLFWLDLCFFRFLRYVYKYFGMVGYNVWFHFLCEVSPMTRMQPVDTWACNVRLNTFRPSHGGRHFTDDIWKCIFLNANLWISIKIWLKIILTGPINNIPALVQIMAWCRPGDKPLSEPIMNNLLPQICVTRPEWAKLKSNKTSFAYNVHCGRWTPAICWTENGYVWCQYDSRLRQHPSTYP